MFIIVSILTTILLVGSAILQRIVFKAAEPTANIYFNQSLITIRPGQDIDVDIQADFGTKTVLTGAQLTLSYDNQQLELVKIIDAPGWQTIASQSKTDYQRVWVMTPTNQAGFIDNPAAKVTFATLRLHALAEGSSSLNLDPLATILAASSPSSPKSVDNVVASVQDSRVIVTASAPAIKIDEPVDQARIKIEQSSPEASFGSQRIINIDTLPTPNSALLLINLQYPARVSVHFGSTRSMDNTARSATTSQSSAIKLTGLAPNQRYYFQVVASSIDTADQIVSQTKSFQTPQFSVLPIDRIKFVIFPPKATNSTVAYALFYDRDDQIVELATPTLATDTDRVSISPLTAIDGLYQASLSNLTSTKRMVDLTLSLDSKEAVNTSMIFDPNFLPNRPKSLSFPLLVADQTAVNTILALIGLLFVTGLGFYKLTRAK